MIIIWSTSFRKDYKKLSSEKKKLVQNSLKIFATNPFNPSLENHSLSGKLKGHFAIKAGYDLRIIYRQEKGYAVVIVVAVGKHDEMYR